MRKQIFSVAGAAVLLTALALPAAGAAGRPFEGRNRDAAKAPFRVWSTLDGRTVLPARVHWLARTTLPAGRVWEVDFLIDGKLRWIEREAPYTFGEDGGYLVRSWLAPRRHRFTVRVTDRSNHSASHTISLRVPARQHPPQQLTGRWQRTVTAADQRKVLYDSPPPAGRWTIVFDEVGIWELDPFGSGQVTEYRARPGVLSVFAPIQMAPDGVGVKKYGRTKIGGYDCSPAGPFGAYRWSVSGSKLVLTAKNEPCGGRRAILEGTWRRVR